MHRLNKIDRFTGREQTFIARQVIDYIHSVVDARTSLTGVEMFRTGYGGRHFALAFDRVTVG
jgi:hypothetical protein